MITGQDLAESFLYNGVFGVPYKLEALTVKVASARDKDVYSDLLHELVKQALFEAFLLLNGQVYGADGRPTGRSLPYRLTAQQREETRQAFAILWGIVAKKNLEPSPISRAKADKGFERFMRAALAARRKRRT